VKLLILGGTVFLGRALTDAALARGHSVTHFNRGSAPEPRVETLVGDRAAGLEALGQRRWDAVIDTCGYVPGAVAKSAIALHDKVGRYLFVSSISVYANLGVANVNEEAPVAALGDHGSETMTPETYGPLKALCEEEIRKVFGERALVVRPGLIVGPHDPTDRFSYWPSRIARGGVVLAPGRPLRGLQFIDVRDLAVWMVALLERQASGTFQATGPKSNLNMGTLLDACAKVADSKPEIAWTDEALLLAHKVAPWTELPLWLPESDASHAGFMKISITRALEAGLTIRPVADTIRDTLAWLATRPPGHAWKAGLAPEREMALLKARQESVLQP
jgi:2'-hydroxyisoflavone reductase